MEITDVRVTELGVDLDRPYGNSRGAFDARGAAIVTVETDVGLIGVGEAIVPEPGIAAAVVEERFVPKLVGENPLDVERLWREMVIENVYWDRKGPGVSAASGVDMALWDLKGKHHEAPVHELLGGDAHGDGRVQAYASDLFWEDAETMAEKAAGYADRGFPAVKTHLGRGIDADEERVAAIQEAIGDAALMVDMNCGLDRAEALRAGRMLERHGVYWYEEPLSPYDVEGLVELRRKLDVPIATGENEYTKWGFKELFAAGAVDYAMPDLMRCGGLTEGRKIAAVAEAFEVTVSPHNFSTGVGLAATLQFMAATPSCDWLEFDVTDFELYEPFFATPLDVDGSGRVAVPTDPGLGVELTDDLVDEFGAG